MPTTTALLPFLFFFRRFKPHHCKLTNSRKFFSFVLPPTPTHFPNGQNGSFSEENRGNCP